MDGLEHGADRLGLALGPEDLALALPLGPQDAALLLALGGEDLRRPDTFGGEHAGALLPLGPHLLLHRVDDALGRVDGLDLHPGDPQPPLARRVVEHTAQPRVDLVPGGERLLQVHVPDHAAQHGRGDLLDGLDVVDDLEVGRPRVGDLEEQHRVDADHQVVLGDHRLPLERHDCSRRSMRGLTRSTNGRMKFIPGSSVLR